MDADLEKLFLEAERSIDHIIQAKKEGHSAEGEAAEPPAAPPLEMPKEEEVRPREEKPPIDPEIAALREALEDRRSRYERLEFEYRNYRERTEREKNVLGVQTRADLLREVLSIVDVFDWAKGAFSAEGSSLNIESFLQGFLILSKQFYDLLERIGLSRVPTEGRPFNPEVHQAVAVVEDDSYSSAKMVLQELKAGFVYEGILLRPAMVKVGIPSRKP